MSGVLFLAHRMPFPPDRGDKIRSFHVLHALAGLGPVHVGCFAESAADLSHAPQLAALAESYCLPSRAKPLPIAGIEALAQRRPISLTAFHHAGMARWVRDTLATGAIDTIYLFSGQMGQYVPREWTGRVVVDLVDVDSAKFEAYALKASGPLRWLHQREARLLSIEESRLARRADTTLLISDAEAALFRTRARDARRVRVLGNGIDTAAFDRAKIAPQAELVARPGPHLIFTGQMDYPPNVAAALRAIDRILPAIRIAHPTTQLHIVGRAPTAALRAKDGKAGVRVWGEVPDVRPFLAGADVMIAPLEIARGVQNKVLEGMAMALPVVLTPGAATGIAARDGEHLAIGNSDAELVERVATLLAHPGQAGAMGTAARRFVAETMSWPAMLAALPEMIGQALPRECRDAA